MKVRLAIAAVLASAAALSGAVAGASTPKPQRTHPSVRPATGGDRTTFRVRFTLRQTPGHTGVMETSYRVEVAPRRNAANSCWPTQPLAVTTGRKGQRVRVALPPPASGWCTGRYHVTVFLERGPYCPPPADGRPQPCPEFATQELDTGETHFTVR